MKSLKLKLMFLLVLTILILTIGMSVYATNENIEIVKISDTNYAIYIDGYESADFYFAFSNDNNADISTLTYKANATDGEKNIAYVNSETVGLFANPTYMWAKTTGGDAILVATEINLLECITKSDLVKAETITKTIKVDVAETETTETTENNVKKTETIGKVKLLEEGSFSYQIIKVSTSEKYKKLNNLAEIISKMNSETTMYTKIKTYKEFYNLFLEMKSELNVSDWKTVENYEIKQPKDVEDGEKFVLWLKGGKIGTLNEDIQFLTSVKKVSEEKITETITTKLPITYDNNTLLIVLAILIVGIIIVCIRIKMLKKKEVK